MRTRDIPLLKRSVSAIGYGGMGLSWAYLPAGERDDEQSVELLREVAGLGVSFFDTSDAYGAGHNETLFGRAFPPATDVVVATKGGLIGSIVDGKHHLVRNGRPEHLRAACEASLQRLGRDVVDLYYLRRVDPDVPLAESWGAMAELVAEGKVRALGLSEVSVTQAEVAQAIHPVTAVQSELSLWTRDALGAGTTPDGEPTGNLLAWTAAHQAVFVPFSPLGRGFLTGALDPTTLAPGDFRAALPRFQAEAAARNVGIVEAVRRVADRQGCTPAAIALAWVLAQGEHVIPIPGSSKIANVRTNLSALDVSLSADDLAELDAIPAAHGARY